jgi:DNA polymerase-3 subunit alpha
MKVNPRVRQVIELATKLGPKFKGGKTIDGISKSVSEHASAVIISPEPLNEIVPVRKNKDVNDSIVTTDWTADPCEALGLLKMDFLGLRNLTVMAIALRYIKESTGDVINLRTIPLDDPKVYKLLGEGDVLGIFQLEASAGMGGICRKIAPKNLEDIGAIIALYRPGPMGSGIMDDYIKRRNNEVEWEYFDDRMIPFTETTFGCMVYQEQVMQASVALCGYTLPDADNLRKIIGKKLVDKVEAEKKKLIAGAVANGMIEEKAQQLADMIEKFGEYGFNKSHSIAYGKITYETAWLKANYPVHYMAALLSSVAGKKARVYGYIHNCREMGIQVLPPDVNYSGEDFTVIGDTIRFGLAAVKSVATKAVEAIIETRGRVGFFRDLNHLYQLLGTSVCNAKTMESLILAGCFDSMGVHRAALLEQYPKIVESMKGRDKKNKKQLPGQTVLFRKLVPNTELSVPVPDVEPFDRMKELAGEKALIGVYVSGHPIEKYATSAKVFNTIDLSVFKSDDEEKIEGMEIEIEAEIETDAVEKPVYNDGDTICVVGIVVKSEKKTSKAGKAYMTAELENLDGSIKLLMFNKTFEEYADLLCEDDIVIIVGKLKLEDGKPSVFVNKVKHLENASMLFVNIPPGIDTTKLYGLKSIASKGLTPVVFTFQEYPDKYIVAHPDSWIDMKPDTMARLLKLCPDLSMEDRKCTNG